MSKHTLKLKPAIFYRRVSTEGQGERGVGFEGQLAAIQKYAELAGFTPVGSYMEVGTGAGLRNVENRPELLKAMSQAKDLGIPIIVSGLDRISRASKDAERLVLEHGLEIISASDGGMTNPVILSSRAARAQFEHKEISERTTKKLQQLKAGGVLLGNRKNLPFAQKKGAAANKARSEKKISEIADFLDTLDDDVSITAPALVKLLNAHGITTSRGLLWSVAALRMPLRKARLIQDERSETAYANNPNYGMF